MNHSNDHYCIILAGGKGRRLWPCSRESKPKQFIDFFGTGKSLLQQTYARYTQILPRENIFICTNKDYLDQVQEQIPDIKASNILADPIFRNTAPSTAWAIHRIMHLNPQAAVVITPSDQTIINEEKFARDIFSGLAFAEKKDCILTVGVRPTRAEPGYGYIQIGEQIAESVYQVHSFTEKPEREFARKFVESGEFYWNTGIFIANAGHAQRSLNNVLPDIFEEYDKQETFDLRTEQTHVENNFSQYTNLTLEHALLEQPNEIYLSKGEFGWADIGSWHGIYETYQKSEDDNVIIDSDVIIENSKANVIKLNKDKLGIINGLEGYIIVEHDNVLLICKKEDSSALVRKYVNEAKMKKGDRYV